MRPMFASLAGVALLCLAARSQSPVLVVHQPLGFGVDFTEIADAVAAASGGEIIYVHSGDYLPFTVDGKSLTILADNSLVNVQGTITIRGLASNQSVVLRGLSSQGQSDEPGLRIDGCAGPVWVEDVSAIGGSGGITSDGAFITNCLAVTLTHCLLVGGGNVPPADPFTSPGGAHGLRLRTSIVTTWETGAIGGDGSYGNDIGGSGGAGVYVMSQGQLYASGDGFHGGASKGGELDFDFVCGCFHCFLGGFGGPGVLASAEDPCLVVLRDVNLSGGEGQENPETGCNGTQGTAIQDFGQHVTTLGGLSRGLTLAEPVARESEPISMLIDGEPGDAVIVLGSLASPIYSVLPLGTLDVAPQIVAVLGALPPSGDLALPLGVVPELGPGVEGLRLLAQPMFFPAGGGKQLGGPSAMVLVDFAVPAG